MSNLTSVFMLQTAAPKFSQVKLLNCGTYAFPKGEFFTFYFLTYCFSGVCSHVHWLLDVPLSAVFFTLLCCLFWVLEELPGPCSCTACPSGSYCDTDPWVGQSYVLLQELLFCQGDWPVIFWPSMWRMTCLWESCLRLNCSDGLSQQVVYVPSAQTLLIP